MPAKKRSRAIWDETRRPNLSTKDKVISYAKAIVYELQPIRFSKLTKAVKSSNFFKKDVMLENVHTLWNVVIYVVSRLLPSGLWKFGLFLKNRSARQWAYVFVAIAYYGFIRWIHDLLDAGPVVIILTLLVVIFTVGLSDDEDSRGRVSAYSVFNRGFERLLGSIDADSLLAQYTGGGMIGVGGVPVHDHQDANARRAGVNEPRNQRRQPPRNNNNNNHGLDENDDDNNGANNNNGNNNRARRSGKKARREQKRNQRQQQQQQEEGLVDDAHAGIDDNVDVDMVAMQHVIEEQIRQEVREG